MTKFTVSKNGTPFKDFTYDEKTKTFFTESDSLVIDFGDEYCITFKTGSDCTFKTGYNCTFKTGYNCTFNTYYNCTFKTGDNCFVIRYDVNGVIEIPENKTIKLNEYKIAGYTIVEPPIETVELTVADIEKLVGKRVKIIKS